MANKINLGRNFETFKDVTSSAKCFKEFVKTYVTQIFTITGIW